MHLGALCPRRCFIPCPVITPAFQSCVSRTPGEPCHDVNSKALQHVAGHSCWRLGWEDEAKACGMGVGRVVGGVPDSPLRDRSGLLVPPTSSPARWHGSGPNAVEKTDVLALLPGK